MYTQNKKKKFVKKSLSREETFLANMAVKNEVILMYNWKPPAGSVEVIREDFGRGPPPLV